MVTVASTASVANLCISFFSPDIFHMLPLKPPDNKGRKMSVVEGCNVASQFRHTTGTTFPDRPVHEHKVSEDDKTQTLSRSSFDAARGSWQLPNPITETFSSSPENSHHWSQNTLSAVFGAVARITVEDPPTSVSDFEATSPMKDADCRGSESTFPTGIQPAAANPSRGQKNSVVHTPNIQNLSLSFPDFNGDLTTSAVGTTARSEPATVLSKEGLRLSDQVQIGSVDSHESTSTDIREHVNESLSDLTTMITPMDVPRSAEQSDIQQRFSSSVSTPSLGFASELNTSYTVRHHAIKELLDTEKSYLDDMRLIVKLFFERIGDLTYLTAFQKKLLVRGAPQILDFHEKFYSSLKVHAEDKRFGLNQSTNIGRCFIEAADEFDIYIYYCAQHEQAVELMNDLKKRQEWSWFLEDVAINLQRVRPQSRMTIADYLIFPVQRICRYPLLLTEIIKYTAADSEGEDRAELVSALKLAKQSASSVNKEKARLETVARTQKFHSRLEEESRLPKEFVQTLGLVLAAGPLEVVILNADPATTAVPRAKFCGVFLFANYMIIVRTKRATAYEPKSWFPLHRWELQSDVPDKDAYVRHSWRLCHLERQYAIEFGATSVNEKAMWVDLLQQTLATSPPTSPDTDRFTSLPWTFTALVHSPASSPVHSPSSPSPADTPAGVVTSDAGTSLKRSASGKEGGRLSGSRRTPLRRSNSTKPFLGSSPANRRSSVESKLTDICTPNVQSSRAAARALSGASFESAASFTSGGSNRLSKSGHFAGGTSAKSLSWNSQTYNEAAAQLPVAEGEQRLRSQTTLLRRPSLSQPSLHSPSTSKFSEVLGRISTIGRRKGPAPKTEIADFDTSGGSQNYTLPPARTLNRKAKPDGLELQGDHMEASSVGTQPGPCRPRKKRFSPELRYPKNSLPCKTECTECKEKRTFLPPSQRQAGRPEGRSLEDTGRAEWPSNELWRIRARFQLQQRRRLRRPTMCKENTAIESPRQNSNPQFTLLSLATYTLIPPKAKPIDKNGIPSLLRSSNFRNSIRRIRERRPLPRQIKREDRVRRG